MVGIATSIPNAFLFWVCLCCHFFEKGIGLSMMIRPLPEKVLIGYATHCNEHVTKAVRDGVNVVVWSFMEIEKEVDGAICINENSLNFDCIRNMITSLDNEGYSETVHLVSFGGWNGPHLSNSTSSEEWYTIWKERVGDIFHGIDWDLEGHDELDSPTNIFSIPCLEKMGCISRMLKDDGYIVGMAPPQSYLNPKSSNFSRRLTWTEQDRPWHREFRYFGSNVYTYILSKYSSYIDFVSVQFYESYSIAGMNLYHFEVSPENFLQSYVDDLAANNQEWFVDFDQDPSLNYSSRSVTLPLSKLVWGFANGWALNKDNPANKVVFFDPTRIQVAYQRLQKSKTAPRGFMFWVIGEEGSNGVYYSRELEKILQTRSIVGSKQAFKDSDL